MFWKFIEFKSIELSCGYFARLDYVSHIYLELNFCILYINSNNIINIMYENISANYLLNLSCTLADSGMVSAILWAFELRELFAEKLEFLFGVRLHCNIFLFNFIKNSSLYTYNIYELLLIIVLNIKIAYYRFKYNSCFYWWHSINLFIFGPISYVSGFNDSVYSSISFSVLAYNPEDNKKEIKILLQIVFFIKKSFIFYIY